MSYYVNFETMNDTMVSKILFEMSTTHTHSTPIKHTMPLAKMRTSNASTSEVIQKKKTFNISNTTFAILPFSHENALTTLPS